MQNCRFALRMNLQMLMHACDTRVDAGTLKIGMANWQSLQKQSQI
jgi:hypothetical protein